jgi:hypothetical protein
MLRMRHRYAKQYYVKFRCYIYMDETFDIFYALLRMRPLLNSWAECSVVISCGKVDYDKSG